MAKKAHKPTVVEKKLVSVADIVISAAEKRKDPTIAIPVRRFSSLTSAATASRSAGTSRPLSAT